MKKSSLYGRFEKTGTAERKKRKCVKLSESQRKKLCQSAKDKPSGLAVNSEVYINECIRARPSALH